MEPKRKHFIVREKKPFVCGNCGQTAMGGRYVNHCPHCLWSKHVDKDIPGDRASSCEGLMKPIGATQKRGKWRIVHQCTECDLQKIVDVAKEDNFEKIIELSRKPLFL